MVQLAVNKNLIGPFWMNVINRRFIQSCSAQIFLLFFVGKKRKKTKILFFRECKLIWLILKCHSVWHFIYGHNKKLFVSRISLTSSFNSSVASVRLLPVLSESDTVGDNRSLEAHNLYTLSTRHLRWGADCLLAINSDGKNQILRM